MRKAFICPTKYVQGQNELLNLGYFVKNFGASALLVAGENTAKRVSSQLQKTAKKYGVTFVDTYFCGECTDAEIARLERLAKAKKCGCVVGLGGGKAIDTAKCVANGGPLIIAPTVAATDAPTSHSAVIYNEDGSFNRYAFFQKSPDVVLVDVSVIAKAPVRFLVSGMGDALSTYFEARATAASFSAVNAGLPCGALDKKAEPAVSTKTALALAELCYETLMEDAAKAKLACEKGVVTPALENIVEANILLSGLGFESGGLAAAHAVQDGLTVLPETHDYYHGEKVAFGLLVQLVMENADEIDTVLSFCEDIGLPVCLEDIGVTEISEKDLMKVAKKACDKDETIHSMPFPVTPEMVADAILAADALGRDYKGLDDEDWDDEGWDDEEDEDDE